MTRQEVRKFAFIGLVTEKSAFFQAAQEAGIIHFIDQNVKQPKQIPDEMQDIASAIRIMRGLPVVKQEELSGLDKALQVAERTIELKKEIESGEEQLRILELEIDRLEIFGNFSREDILYIEKEGRRYVQFFCAKAGKKDLQKLPSGFLYVGSLEGMDYFVSIEKEKQALEGMVEMHFPNSLQELKEKRESTSKMLHKSRRALLSLARYNHYLHSALVDAMNRHQLNLNLTYTGEPVEGAVFAVDGWVPVTQIAELQTLVNQWSVYAEEVKIEPTDVMPTYLENEGLARIGEDLVHIYDTPSCRDKDPSLWILGAFSMFFAFIINDAGYGLIFFLLALFLKYRFPDAKPMMRRVTNLVLILSVATMVWGVLMNAYFGIKLDIESPLRKISLLHWLADKKVHYAMEYNVGDYQGWLKEFPQTAEASSAHEILKLASVNKGHGVVYPLLESLERNIFLELAILFGLIHLSCSLARNISHHWNGVGWILALWGGYYYISFYLGNIPLPSIAFGIPPSFGQTEGMQLFIGGMVIAAILSVIQHRLKGLASIMEVTQLFGDTLSYLRLYALGLAAAILAETLNELVVGLPLFVMLFILFLSHGINMLLGVMSGVIHGLRLNFLEWYRYSFEGGGKPFRPLKKLDLD